MKTIRITEQALISVAETLLCYLEMCGTKTFNAQVNVTIHNELMADVQLVVDYFALPNIDVIKVTHETTYRELIVAIEEQICQVEWDIFTLESQPSRIQSDPTTEKD